MNGSCSVLVFIPPFSSEEKEEIWLFKANRCAKRHGGLLTDVRFSEDKYVRIYTFIVPIVELRFFTKALQDSQTVFQVEQLLDDPVPDPDCELLRALANLFPD